MQVMGVLEAALLQDGRPLAYASRALPAEKNFARIEKELLAIVFATERFHRYTYGRQVIVESDHKPWRRHLPSHWCLPQRDFRK